MLLVTYVATGFIWGGEGAGGIIRPPSPLRVPTIHTHNIHAYVETFPLINTKKPSKSDVLLIFNP